MKLGLMVTNEPKQQGFAIFESVDKALASLATIIDADESPDRYRSFFYDEVSEEYWYSPCECHDQLVSYFICEIPLTEPE